LTPRFPSEFDTFRTSRRGAGGNARLLGTLELIFPLPFAEESNSFRTSFFIDAGNVWDTKFSTDKYAGLENFDESQFSNYSDPDAIRVSTGLSVQWLSPLGPLTLSFSKPIRKEETDDTEFFSFDIGRTF
jgi:outer membrane protein insertion porin family